jgi:hypothetical protein
MQQSLADKLLLLLQPRADEEMPLLLPLLLLLRRRRRQQRPSTCPAPLNPPHTEPVLAASLL